MSQQLLTPGYWTHARFRDVFVEVIKFEGHHAGQDVYQIEWWNRGASGNAFPINERDLIGLDADDYSQWQPYDPDAAVRAAHAKRSQLGE